MKQKIKIIYSKYYFDELTLSMLELSKKKLKNYKIDFDIVGVPGSFEIPYEIARSIKKDIINNESYIGSFKGKQKEETRNNIVQIAKLSQLNLNNHLIYSGYLALGCIIKGHTINHQAISTSIFTNLQRISIENVMPIGNGIFNANNMTEAKKKYTKCTYHAIETLLVLLKNEKKS